MNYYHQTIELQTNDLSINDLIKWIKRNNCPNLDLTYFKDKSEMSSIWTVSLLCGGKEMEKGDWIKIDKETYLREYDIYTFLRIKDFDYLITRF